MLSDFLLLETYYDSPDTVRVYEELSKKYGKAAIQKAVEAGHIMSGRSLCGSGKAGWFFWITDKGRKYVSSGAESNDDDHAVPA